MDSPVPILQKLHPATRILWASGLLLLILQADGFTDFLPPIFWLVGGMAFGRVEWWPLIARNRYLLFFYLIVILWPLVSFGGWTGLRYGAESALRIFLVYTTASLLAWNLGRWEASAVMEKVLQKLPVSSSLSVQLALTLGMLPVMASSGGRLWAHYQARTGFSRRQRIRHLPLLLGAVFDRGFRRAEIYSRALAVRHFRGQLYSAQAVSLPDWRFSDGLALFALILTLLMIFF